jgi:hypothetical protein
MLVNRIHRQCAQRWHASVGVHSDQLVILDFRLADHTMVRPAHNPEEATSSAWSPVYRRTQDIEVSEKCVTHKELQIVNMTVKFPCSVSKTWIRTPLFECVELWAKVRWHWFCGELKDLLSRPRKSLNSFMEQTFHARAFCNPRITCDRMHSGVPGAWNEHAGSMAAASSIAASSLSLNFLSLRRRLRLQKVRYTFVSWAIWDGRTYSV